MKYFNDILNSKKGFILLYAILIMSIILAFTFSITDLTIKERKLSRFGEESSSAFFAAESGMECALYWDLIDDESWFRYDSINEPGGREITCNGKPFIVGDDVSGITKIDLVFSDSSNSSTIIVDKSDTDSTSLMVSGYSVVDSSLQNGVERGIQVTYGDTVDDDDEDCVFDIALVLDSSGSIGVNMGKLKTAAKQIVENNELGEDKFKFMVVEFEADATLRMELTSNKDDVDNAIDSLASIGGTNMEGGLFITKHEFLSLNNRDDVEDVTVVITDGNTNMCTVGTATYTHSGTGSSISGWSCGGGTSELNTKKIAKELKDQGVYIIAIGVGITSSTYEDYLKDEIASIPENYYSVNNFQKLKQLTEDFDCSVFSRAIGNFEREEF